MMNMYAYGTNKPNHGIRIVLMSVIVLLHARQRGNYLVLIQHQRVSNNNIWRYETIKPLSY